VLSINAGINGPLEEEYAAEPVDGGDFFLCICLLVGRQDRFWFRQKIAYILPGAGRKKGSAARKEEGDKKYQNQKEDKSE
jgi:hypothetical protein